MSEQQMRDALEAAVPQPPRMPDRGSDARRRARYARHRRFALATAAATALVVGVPVARALHHDTSDQVISSVVTHGLGAPACRELSGVLPGHLADHRSVDGPTVRAWLNRVGSSSDPGSVVTGQATVCVFTARTAWGIAVTQPDRHPVVVERDTDYPSVVRAMTALDRLTTGGATTTDAPFACPRSQDPGPQDLSNFLPSGATGVLLCYGDATLYSPRDILGSPGVDALVLAVDRSPLAYVAPNIVCGGITGFRTYSLVFRYPSGTRTVSMEECRGLAIGAFTREAPSDLDRRLEHWLLDSGALLTDPPTCPLPGTAPSGVGDVRHLVAARWCPAGPPGSGTLLAGRDLRDLQRWGRGVIPGTTGPDGACQEPSVGWPRLALTDDWGNAFTATVECGRGLISVHADDPRQPLIHPASLRSRAWTHLLHRLEAAPG
jgi:hypothetical protein